MVDDCTGLWTALPRASPAACHACFPEISESRFVARALHAANMMSLFDLFIAPSAFIRDRYIAWGLPAAKIRVVANGLPSAPAAASPSRARCNFGFFGNLAPHKGVLLALAAAQQLAREHVEMTFRVHGGFNFQPKRSNRLFSTRFSRPDRSHIRRRLCEREDIPRAHVQGGLGRRAVGVVGECPLVILEAMQHGRPVICSDIGGLAEMVGNERTGLHFHAGDASDLARTMLRAAVEPGLWQRLRGAAAAAATLRHRRSSSRNLPCALAKRGGFVSLMPDSCTILREPTGAPEDDAPVLATGSLPLAVVLDQRTMLLFGWLASAPPETASVSFGAGALHGDWQATTWRAAKSDDTALRHFVAVLRAENIVRAQTMPMVLLAGRRRAGRTAADRTHRTRRRAAAGTAP